MQRWDPWSDIVSLREAMNSLLEDSFVRARGGAPRVGGSLAVDVKEKDDAYEIRASVPGVKPEDVDVSVLGDTVRIRGRFESERRNDQDQEQGTDSSGSEGGQGGGQRGERWLIRERRSGSFERVVTLPSAVKSDDATAEFQDGVLTITLPKAEEAKPRSIPVGAKAHEIDVESHSKGKSSSENKESSSD
jgi:HSP20 family protein